MGPCCLSPVPGGGPLLTPVSAGEITVQGANGRTIATLDPDPASAYTPAQSGGDPALVWMPGDKLGVSAAGSMAGVGPFVGSIPTGDLIAGAMAAGKPLSTTTPALVDTTVDLVVTWTVDTTAMAESVVVGVAGTMHTNAIVCRVMDSAGTVTVPAALLGRYQAGEGGSIDLVRSSSLPPMVPAVNATVSLSWGTSVYGVVLY